MPILLLRSVAVLTLLIPALALTSAVGGPVIIYLTALIALATMAVNLSRRWEPFALKELVPMAIALGVPLLVMFINNVSLGIGVPPSSRNCCALRWRFRFAGC